MLLPDSDGGVGHLVGVAVCQFGKEEQPNQMGEHIFTGGALVKYQPVKETSQSRWWWKEAGPQLQWPTKLRCRHSVRMSPGDHRSR